MEVDFLKTHVEVIHMHVGLKRTNKLVKGKRKQFSITRWNNTVPSIILSNRLE